MIARTRKRRSFSSSALLGTLPESQQVVGDGKLIKIDLIAPDNAAAGNLVATVEVGGTVKIGDEIRVAVGVGTQTRFREGGMQIQIKALETPQQNVIATPKTIETANFTPLQVINAAGDSIRASVELTEGLLKSKAKAAGSDRDGADIGKDAAYEGDNMEMQLLARTKDQAGNWSAPPESINFTGDTRKPGVSVLYPAAGGRFTGAHADVEFDEHLNPLQLRVDEDIKSLSVYAKGAYSADDDEDPDTEVSIIHLWEDETRDFVRSDVVASAGADAVGDTTSYGTLDLQWRNADVCLESNRSGR